MHHYASAPLVLLAAALVAAPAAAQSVKKGTLSGTIVSASAAVPSGGNSTDLLTTPAAGSFVLTQACVRGTDGANNEDSVNVEGSSVGRLALRLEDALGACTEFTPGLAIPPGETLRCVQSGASASPGFCTVTGIQSKK